MASAEESLTRRLDELTRLHEQLQEDYDEIMRQFGDQLGAFPGEGIDGFLSHFIITLAIAEGELAGRVVSFTLPPSSQTVARSEPFIYEGREARHSVRIPLPEGCTLPNSIGEDDFVERPEEFFEVGKQSVWMQILNLGCQG